MYLDFYKCPQRALKDNIAKNEERISEFKSLIEEDIDSPDDKIFTVGDDYGRTMTCSVGEVRGYIKENIKENDKYEKFLNANVYLCEGCTDEYYLTGSSLKERKDCPLKFIEME